MNFLKARWLIILGFLSFAVASQAAPCVIEGRTYECQPNITSPWIYSATASGGFPSPFVSTSAAAVNHTLAAFDAFFRRQTSSLSYGSLGPFHIGNRGARQYASMPISIVWYPNTAPETAYLSVVGQRDAFTCPAGYTSYWAGDQGIYWEGTYEGPLCYAQLPPKVIAIDPGHGLTCAALGMPPGAIGVTDFPVSNPPPGSLKEDELTMAVAIEFKRLASSKYTVVLTKNSANTCPEYRERGKVAIKAKADVFVSVHINRRNPIPFNPFANGTSAVYNSSRPAAKTLADLMAASVSTSLGVNNRGAKVDDGLAVLKEKVTPMTAVLIEAARLSGSDEEKLHSAGSATKVAEGIKAALDAYFGN